jgi:hypothetical protein
LLDKERLCDVVGMQEYRQTERQRDDSALLVGRGKNGLLGPIY